MKMSIKQILISCLFVAFLASCDDRGNEIAPGSNYNQIASLYIVNKENKKITSLQEVQPIESSISEESTQHTLQFQFSLYKENPSEVLLSIEPDSSAIVNYNQIHNTHYLPLPKEKYTFTKTLTAKEGSVTSNPGEVNITADNSLLEDQVYMLALTANSQTPGVSVMQTSKTLFYTIVRSKGKIKTSVALKRNLYLAIKGGYIRDIGNTFTMEALIYVNKFRGAEDFGDVGISTFMGTEGAALLRFGDSGVPANHLQALGQDIGVEFKPKKWYHIAIVVDGDNNRTTAYVDGKKVSSFQGARGLGEFFIGKSYNDNRGIDAKFAEVRLWKTTRSAIEISENMTGVDPTHTGLYAYWKMNEADGVTIPDASGNGRTLTLRAQQAGEGADQVELVPEDGITIE